MDAGAIGLSSGVFYSTGAAADVDELALLAGIAGEAGGVYTTHIRDEMNEVFAALDEAFETARRGQVPVVISHHKCAGPRNWGRTTQTLAHIDAARARQPIGLDAYPYVAGSTVLRATWSTGSSTSSSRRPCRIRKWRRGTWPTSPPSGTARSRKPASGCSPAAPATSRCARTTSSGCFAIRPR